MKTINCQCPRCKTTVLFTMTDEQYNKYVHGEDLIQNIFPEIRPSKREMLISGICPDCWKKIFK